jgi:predicted pyridoxine 5'-phosphate oxidase superfamily flavin-nucleotide-binding protein
MSRIAPDGNGHGEQLGCERGPSDDVTMRDTYSGAARALQDRFDTRRLADRLHERFRAAWTLEDVRPFIQSRAMFFLATADGDGRPQCSYKGGAPGFVRVLEPMELCFPNYDGNGMYLSMGNLVENPAVGLLFIDFASPSRVRVSGRASITDDRDLVESYPGAQFVVRVAVDEVFPNCPRYIHRMDVVEQSAFVPAADGSAPVPDWKRAPWACDVLPAGDPARD